MLTADAIPVISKISASLVNVFSDANGHSCRALCTVTAEVWRTLKDPDRRNFDQTTIVGGSLYSDSFRSM
jgi:hypothetical protein